MMAKEGKFFDEMETMPLAEREKVLVQRLQKVIQHAYKNAPAVKVRFDRAGVDPSQIQSIKDLERIPVITKDQVKEMQRENPPFGGFLAVSPENIARIYMSPGPIYEPAIRGATLPMGRMMHTAGFRKGDIVLNTFSYHLSPAGLGVDDALVANGITVIPGGVGNTDLQVQLMHDLKVTGYFGTPSFLWTLIKRAEERGYDFRRDFCLRNAFLTAEMVPPSMKRAFEEDYGVYVVEGYGIAEVGMIAVECEQKQGMHLSGEMVIEIVDPPTGKQMGPGEAGEVVITTFEEAYPLIRFGTGDLSLYTDEPCGCGRTSPRLVRILGRVGEAVKVRGMFLHGKEVGEVVSSFPELANFQAIVDRFEHRDYLTVKVELADETVDRDKLLEAFDKAFRDKCRVRADKVEFVPKGTIPEDVKKIEDRRTWD
jgi:phenylacetate-CoA ligase